MLFRYDADVAAEVRRRWDEYRYVAGDTVSDGALMARKLHEAQKLGLDVEMTSWMLARFALEERTPLFYTTVYNACLSFTRGNREDWSKYLVAQQSSAITRYVMGSVEFGVSCLNRSRRADVRDFNAGLGGASVSVRPWFLLFFACLGGLVSLYQQLVLSPIIKLDVLAIAR